MVELGVAKRVGLPKEGLSTEVTNVLNADSSPRIEPRRSDWPR